MPKKRKPRGYWSLEKTLEECKTIVQMEGDLPSQTEFYQKGLGHLAGAIQRNGGIYKIKKILGLVDKIPESRTLTRKKSIWPDINAWITYGLERGYDKRNPKSFDGSKKEKEFSWYLRGSTKKWLPSFPFTRLRKGWGNIKLNNWIEYGLERGYDKRNPTSLFRSKNKLERSWYYKGREEGWVNDFTFKRSIIFNKDIQIFLEKNSEAGSIASLVSITDDTNAVAEILVKLWPDRFMSASDLAKSLPGAVRRIGYSLHPFSISNVGDFKQRIQRLPSEVRYSLDSLLLNIALDQYQKPFNNDPEGTLLELNDYKVHNSGVRQLATKVLNHYKDVYSFEIPGHGKLGETT
ncbi:hypothetical protein HY212_05730 [Candidatus Pacearchaeota archaeon]|nr:hypothetical protein [Candidatus Pacearchaeota archaeon]